MKQIKHNFTNLACPSCGRTSITENIDANRSSVIPLAFACLATLKCDKTKIFLNTKLEFGHVHKGSFWLFCGHLNSYYILINYFPLTYKVGINHAPVINRTNDLSENILCLKNDIIVTEI